MKQEFKLPQKTLSKKIVFLDLEDTVIDDFTKGLAALPCNHDKVKRFVHAQAADEVRLFSFAVDNEHDVKVFNKFMRNWLEACLEVKFEMSNVFTTEQLYLLCRRHSLVFEDVRECLSYHGKSYGFQRYVELSPEFDDCELVLVDDAVEPMTISYPERNLLVTMVNVNSLL